MTYQPVYAGKWRRFLTFVVDYVGFFATNIVVILVAGIIWGEAALPYLEGYAGWGVGLLVYLGYYMAFEGAFARTPGKWVTGTLVVNEQGDRPSFLQVVGRSLSRFIPFEPFSVLLEDDGRALHDSLPKTYVVRCRGVSAVGRTTPATVVEGE